MKCSWIELIKWKHNSRFIHWQIIFHSEKLTKTESFLLRSFIMGESDIINYASRVTRDIPQTRFHVTCFFMHVHCITSCTVTMVTLTWNIWSFLCDKFLLIIKINVVLLTFNWTKKLKRIFFASFGLWTYI